MRDIRGDLQDRATLLEEQISAQEAQFETLVKQIKAEHEARREDLRAEFDAVTKLLELEHRRLGNAPQALTTSAQPAPQPQQPLADFLVRKMNEVGAMSRDDLRRLSLQEGYFVDAGSAERGVHATLLELVKAGLIRQ